MINIKYIVVFINATITNKIFYQKIVVGMKIDIINLNLMFFKTTFAWIKI